MTLRVEALVEGRAKPLRAAIQADRAKAIAVGDMVALSVDLTAAAALKADG
jgi:hypothetical protein